MFLIELLVMLVNGGLSTSGNPPLYPMMLALALRILRG